MQAQSWVHSLRVYSNVRGVGDRIPIPMHLEAGLLHLVERLGVIGGQHEGLFRIPGPAEDIVDELLETAKTFVAKKREDW